MSAFIGMCLCIVVGFTGPSRPLTLVVPGAFLTFVWLRAMDGAFDIPLSIFLTALTILPMLKRHERETFTAFFDSLNAGVRYALAVSAAGAAVGIVIGIINTTGVAFRLGFLVTQGASDLGGTIHGLFDLIGLGWLLTTEALQTFLSLLFIAILCILMGAGLPTTALYIMLVSVAQPALALLGIPAMATHFFVLYYGVISEITPPVCAAAYAAAGIAGSNPFRTGITAFTLGIGKLLVPMVFVYAPVILIVLPEYWNLAEFLQVSLTCAIGVYCLSVAIAGYNTKPIPGLMRWIAGIAGILLVAPGTPSDLIAVGLIALFVLSERMLLKEQPA